MLSVRVSPDVSYCWTPNTVTQLFLSVCVLLRFQSQPRILSLSQSVDREKPDENDL